MHEHSHSIVITAITSLCCLLLLIAVLRHYAKKSIVPSEGWILLIGISYGIVLKLWNLPLPRFELSPDMIILVFLPLLIFSSGRLVDLGILKSEALPIGLFAIIGVLVTSFMIGAPIAWTLGIPLIHGLLIGAAAGATDPAAIAAIFHSFDIPERLGLVVEGESLFNDGTTVVLFALISGIVLSGSDLSVPHSLALFTWAIAGAIPLGILFGWCGAKTLNLWRENNVFFEVSMTFLITYAAFLIGEKLLHVSGVIAVLLAAIVYFKTRNKDAKHFNYAEQFLKDQTVLSEFWEYFSALINGFLFFSLGVATGLHDFAEVPAIAMVAALTSLVVSRAIMIYGGCAILRIFKRRFLFSWQNVLFLGGLRGAVCAALILTIPDDYEYKGVFLCLAFAIIAFTLIVQPTLMKIYLCQGHLLKKNEAL